MLKPVFYFHKSLVVSVKGLTHKKKSASKYRWRHTSSYASLLDLKGRADRRSAAETIKLVKIDDFNCKIVRVNSRKKILAIVN